MQHPILKFGCGCIGVVANLPMTSGRTSQVIKLKSCCAPEQEIMANPCDDLTQDQIDKAQPLPDDECLELLKEINNLIVRGYRYREIRRLLALK